MNQVELIRQRIIRGQQRELVTLRQYISMIGGNNEVLDKLQGMDGDKLLADVTDFLLMRLGHDVVPAKKDGRTQSNKAVSKAI